MGFNRSALLLIFFGIFNFSLGEYVVTLGKENFTDFISQTEIAVVEFYAPWCGHCQRLAPEYEKAAEALKAQGSKAVLVKVDADQKKNKKLAKTYGVEGFPTLKVIRAGATVEEYKGPRDADGIVNYVNKLTGPASLEVTKSDEAESLITKNSVLVVGFFKDFESDEFKTFFNTAESLREELTFVHTGDASLFPAKESPVEFPSVRIYKDFDEGFADTKVFESEALKSFLSSSSVPSVVEMSQDPKNRPHLEKIFSLDSPKFLLFLDYGDAKIKESLSEAYGKVAKIHKSVGFFIIGDEKDNNHALEYFGVKKEDSPVLLIHDPPTDKKYIKEKIKGEEIESFISDFSAGKLVAKIKSEPIPTTNDGPVKVVVAKNFDDIVFSGKNVLLEFYAPWCGHCKKLAPKYESVGTHFKDDNSVIIAKIDATANDIPKDKFDVSGYPTLFFVDATGKISLYEGKREKKDIISFIDSNKVEIPSNDTLESKVPTEEAPEDKKDEL